ncbi:hypothetical protein ACLOJK_000134 [Asimina triloba]
MASDSVSPHLSMGTEVFWLGHQRKSGIGFAARYNTDKMVAAGQVASTGIVALSYVQKVSEKVSIASDFLYNPMTRDATASFGYDYMLRQCRLRGKLDSNGCVGALLEERLNMGITFLLSAERVGFVGFTTFFAAPRARLSGSGPAILSEKAKVAARDCELCSVPQFKLQD